MKQLLILLFSLVFLLSCRNNPKQDLEDKCLITMKDGTILIDYDTKTGLKNELDTLELIYIQYACDCPQWVILKEYERITASYPYDQIELNKYSFYIEPAVSEIKIPDDVFLAKNKIRLIGKEYVSNGYPKDPDFMDPNPPKGRVFRYYSYEILKPFRTVYSE